MLGFSAILTLGFGLALLSIVIAVGIELIPVFIAMRKEELQNNE